MNTATSERRVGVYFSGQPPYFYRAEAVVAWNISAAFARDANPAITVDEKVEPGLRLFPCYRLFQQLW